jgi:DNA (cytosine-5)-methyltransferase 1
LIATQSSGEYWERHDIPRKTGPKRAKELVLPLLHGGVDKLPWRTVRDALSDLRKPSQCEKEAWQNHWLIPGARRYTGHDGSQLDWPSKTIKAGVHGVPGGENTIIDDGGHFRYYTLRELARIQTFPDEHLFAGARLHVTKQIGNAVPCALAEAIVRPLYELLNTHSVKDIEVWR